MISSSTSYALIRSIFLIFILLVLENGVLVRFAESGKRKIHITDDLDDVVDDEEDEAWKEWGKKRTPDLEPPPTDFSGMKFSEIQATMQKYQTGPLIGFVKLRLGTARTPDTIVEIAKKWSSVARTGGLEVSFTGVDISTIMFNLEKGQDSVEFKDFILTQPEAYEVKIANEFYRRPGDPPFDVVFEKFHAGKLEEDPSMKDNSNKKDEF